MLFQDTWGKKVQIKFYEHQKIALLVFDSLPARDTNYLAGAKAENSR